MSQLLEILGPTIAAQYADLGPVNPGETAAEALARHRADIAAEVARYESESATHPATSDCLSPECDVCSFRDCPHRETMHYHHDGCPACHGAADVGCAVDAPERSAWPLSELLP